MYMYVYIYIATVVPQQFHRHLVFMFVCCIIHTYVQSLSVFAHICVQYYQAITK